MTFPVIRLQKLYSQKAYFSITLLYFSISHRLLLPLSDKTLLLEKNGTVYSYSRSDEAQTSQTALPAQQKETISVKGELIIAHEVRSFVADGDTVCYWVIDKTGELYKQYDELTKGQKNGVPVHAELEVRDMGKSQEGFAAEYDGVYEVVKIDKLSAK